MIIIPIDKYPTALVEYALRHNIGFSAAWEINGRFGASGSPSSLFFDLNMAAWGTEPAAHLHYEIRSLIHNKDT